MLSIDFNQALRLVNDEIAKVGPKHVYDEETPVGGCVNVKAKYDETAGKVVYTGSCIVGRALIAAGYDARDLYILAVDSDVQRLEESLDVEFTDKARSFLSRVQYRQDGGTPWGEAVADAFTMVQGLDFDTDESFIRYGDNYDY